MDEIKTVDEDGGLLHANSDSDATSSGLLFALGAMADGSVFRSIFRVTYITCLFSITPTKTLWLTYYLLAYWNIAHL